MGKVGVSQKEGVRKNLQDLCWVILRRAQGSGPCSDLDVVRRWGNSVFGNFSKSREKKDQPEV